MPAQGSATAPIHGEVVRDAADAGRGLRGARIDRMTEARVFSYPVSDIFVIRTGSMSGLGISYGDEKLSLLRKLLGLSMEEKVNLMRRRPKPLWMSWITKLWRSHPRSANFFLRAFDFTTWRTYASLRSTL